MSKQIVLKYEINGVKFKRYYDRENHKAAAARAAVLVENGVAIQMRNFPKRITIPCGVPTVMETNDE